MDSTWGPQSANVARAVGSPNSIVHGDLFANDWNSFPHTPLSQKFAGTSAASPFANARSRLQLNADGFAIVNGGFMAAVTLPLDAGTDWQFHIDDVSHPTGTGAFALEVLDGTGTVVLSTTSFTPTTTITSYKTATITPLVPGGQYILRVNCNPAGAAQSSPIVGQVRFVPVAPGNTFYRSAFSAVPGPGFDRHALNEGRWAGNVEQQKKRDNARFPRVSPRGYVDVETTTASMIVSVFDSVGGFTGAPFDGVALVVDGVPLEPSASPTPPGVNYLTFTIPTAVPGSSRRVRISDGMQTAQTAQPPVTEPLVCRPTAILVPAGTSVRFADVAPRRRIVVSCDSRLIGAYSLSPQTRSYVDAMRANGLDVTLVGAGGNSYSKELGQLGGSFSTFPVPDAVLDPSSPAMTRFAERLVGPDGGTPPAEVILALGYNDFSSVVTVWGSTARLVTAMGNVALAIRRLSPGTIVVFTTPFHAASEPDQDVTNESFAASIRTLATSATYAPFCRLLDLRSLWSVSGSGPYLYIDGVHLSDLGHAVAAAALLGRWPGTPMQLGPLVWAEVDAGVVGAEMGAVFASGSSPPTMAITGTPAPGIVALNVECMLGGAVGTARIRWAAGPASDAGGRNWNSPNGDVVTANGMTLGSTGLAISFSGPLTKGNAWSSTVIVQQLSDLSGNWNHLVQPTDASRPPFVLAADIQQPIDERPRFSSGVNLALDPKFLRVAGLNQSTYTVASFTKFLTTGGNPCVFGCGADRTAPLIYLSASTTVIANSTGGGIAGTVADPTVLSSYFMVVNGVSSVLEVNGTAFTGTLAQSATNFAWGYDAHFGFTSNQNAEVFLVFPRALSAVERRMVVAYFEYKALPASPTVGAPLPLTSISGTSPITVTGSTVGIQASSSSQAGSMSQAQAMQLAALPSTFAGGFFELDVTLVGGTKTQASGKDLTNAKIVAVRLKTPTTAVGTPVAIISGNNVVVTSYAAGAVQAVTDASTYTVEIVGAM